MGMGGESVGLGTILLLALLPAAGSIIGIAVAEWREPPEWLTGGAMHAAAGLGMAVAAIELIPRAQERIDPWMLAITLVFGAFVAVGLARTTRALRHKLTKGTARATTWGAFAAIGVDLLSDGLMTGSGGAVSGSLGLLLALSQVFGNLPGGFAVAANFRAAEVPRRQRLGAMAVYPFMPAVGALGGYLALQDASEMVTGLVLAAFGGLLLTATIEDIVPEADEPEVPRHISSPSFGAGFAALVLMSAYLS